MTNAELENQEPSDEFLQEDNLDEVDEDLENADGDHSHGLSADELYASHGGNPKNLKLDLCMLCSNLPSDLLEDDYKIFQQVVIDIVTQELKTPLDFIDNVIRIPKLQTSAPDQANAVCAVISLKKKVQVYRAVAQAKVVGSSYTLTHLGELPREWFEDCDLDLSDEVDGADENCATKETSIVDEEEEKKPDDKDSVEKQRQKEREDREAFNLRYKEDDDDDIAFTSSWEGAPEFQWKICSSKTDQRKIILEGVIPTDLEDPFLYRAMIRCEDVTYEFPQRYNSDGTKSNKGRMILTFARDYYLMRVAMRSLIYIRNPNKRRIKVLLPQHDVTLKDKDEFEKRLGRVIERTQIMRQLVVKIIPDEVTVDKAMVEEWFPEVNIEDVEEKIDGRGRKAVVVTFKTIREAMEVHAINPFVTIGETRCHVFYASIEVNKQLLSNLDKQEEKDAHRAEVEKKRKEEKEERERRTIKRRVESEPAEKKPRYESTYRGRGRGFVARGTFRGSYRARGTLTPSTRTVGGRGSFTPRYSNTTSSFPRREEYRSTDGYRHDMTHNAFEFNSRSSAFGGSSTYKPAPASSAFSAPAFDYNSRDTSSYYGDRRRNYDGY